jgi:hypothetical protein
MLTYTELKEKHKEFLAATGLTVAEFELILPIFRIKLQTFLSQARHAKGNCASGKKEVASSRDYERLRTNCFSFWFTRKRIRSKRCMACSLV